MKIRILNHGMFKLKYLVLILLVIYLPIAINGFVLYRRAINIEKKERLMIVRHMMDQSVNDITKVLDSVKETMDEQAEHNGIRRGLQVFDEQEEVNREAIKNYLDLRMTDALDKHPVLKNAFMVTAEGYVFRAENTEPISGMEWTLDHLEYVGSRTDVWELIPYNEAVSETMDACVMMARPIFNLNSDTVAGYYVGVVDMGYLLKEQGAFQMGYTVHMAMYKEDDPSFVFASPFEISLEDVEHLIENSDFRKTDELIIKAQKNYIQVEPISDTSWLLVTQVDEDDLLNSVKKALQNSYLLLLHITLTTSFVLITMFVLGASIYAEKDAALYRYELSEEWNQKLRVYRHDIMNHLQVIQALIELDYKDRAIEHIKKLAQEGKITKSKCNIGIPEIESALLSNLAPAKEMGCAVKVDCIPLEDQFPYDSYEIVKILSNLIRNAVQALKEHDDDTKELRVKIHKDNAHYFFEVTNSGPPIPEALHESIFEKGFSTKEGRGRGLGLFIVQRIAEKHKGRVDLRVNSTGNCFTVMLPVQNRI